MTTRLSLENEKDSLISQLPEWRKDGKFCDTFIYSSSLQTISEKNLVTKISFTKSSTQIPSVQKCHRFVLGMIANNFLLRILREVNHDEELHILLPDFDKQETDTFLKFIYGQLDELDLSLPIAKLFFVNSSVPKIVTKEEPVDYDDYAADYYLEPTVEYDEDYLPPEPPAKKKRKKKQVPGEYSDNDPISKLVTHKKRNYNLKLAKEKSSEAPKNRIKEEQEEYLAQQSISDVKERHIWPCPCCTEESELFQFSQFLKHIESEHPEKVAKSTCERCGRNQESKEEFMVHYINETCHRRDKGEWKCQECPCYFHGFRNLQSHVFLHHYDSCIANLSTHCCTYFCEICCKCLDTVTGYQKHMQSMHKISENWSDVEESIQLQIEKDKGEDAMTKESLDFILFCRNCKGKFENKKSFRDHFDTQHAEDLKFAKENNVHYDFTRENLGFARQPECQEIEKNLYAFCYICEMEFKGRSGFHKHFRSHHQSDTHYPCQHCQKPLLSKILAIQHKKKCTQSSSKRTVPCELCDLKFLDEGRLKVHMTVSHYNGEQKASRPVHETVKLEDGRTRYKCDICGKLLNSNKSVYHHKDVFHGTADSKLKLKCTVEGCNYSSHLRLNLKNHTIRQHGERKHFCDKCGKNYSTPRELEEHYNLNHVHEEHICQHCGKIFTNPVSLKKHLKIHVEATLVCHLCGKAFKTRNNIRSHMLYTHGNRKDFHCDCGKDFKSSSHLKRHWGTANHFSGFRFSKDGKKQERLQREIFEATAKDMEIVLQGQ